jgi:hypothetical protein
MDKSAPVHCTGFIIRVGTDAHPALRANDQ